ncbi:hypothetical protein ACE7GA_06610 [Roseomonas sp. CCTCC AB2023176]|uniref:hypothetical protein n=1 Tax=Roseomonas sp. CCTCC AB2023176 TaxID=3342640 RepID=UPI0035D9167B
MSNFFRRSNLLRAAVLALGAAAALPALARTDTFAADSRGRAVPQFVLGTYAGPDYDSPVAQTAPGGFSRLQGLDGAVASRLPTRAQANPAIDAYGAAVSFGGAN